MTTSGEDAHGASPAGITLDDLWLEFGDRWDITLITGGYRALIAAQAAQIRSSGRPTPGGLAGSIGMAERQL